VVHPGAYSASGTRLSFYCRFFRFWRGSETFIFRFVSSPLMSYKAGISVGFAGKLENGTDQEDVITRLVTVRGTTTISVNVPYLHTAPWQLTAFQEASSVSFTRISVFIVDPPVTVAVAATAITPVYCWRMAGPDFQLTGLRDFNDNFTEDTRVIQAQSRVFQEAIDKEVPFYMGTQLPSEVDMLDVMFVEDIGRRFSEMHTPPTELGTWLPTDYMGFLPNATWIPNISLLGSCFLFSRGELDWKLRLSDTSGSDGDIAVAASTDLFVPLAAGSEYFQRVPDGQARINPNFGNILEYSSPWYCLYDLVQHNSFRGSCLIPLENCSRTPLATTYAIQYGLLPMIITNGVDQIATPEETLVKFGAGFGLFYEMPPPGDAYYPLHGTLPQNTKKSLREMTKDLAVRADGTPRLVKRLGFYPDKSSEGYQRLRRTTVSLSDKR